MSITKRPVFRMPADVEPIFEFPLRIFSNNTVNEDYIGVGISFILFL
jgi:hypothetical protein